MKRKLLLLMAAVATCSLMGCGSGAENVTTENVTEDIVETTVDNKDENTEVESKESEFDCLQPNINDDTSEWNYNEVVAKETDISDVLRKAILDKSGDVVDVTGIMDAFRNGEIKVDDDSDDADLINVGIADAGNDSCFGMYVSDKGRYIVSTPDGKFLNFGDVSMVDFIWEMLPSYACEDFDSDGENELYLNSLVFHGTGFLQESAFMIDKSENGQWEAYHITPDWFTEKLSERVKFLYNQNEVYCEIDGKGVDEYKLNTQADALNLYLDSLVIFENQGKEITVNQQSILIGDEEPAGVFLTPLAIKISYLGAGKWEMTDISVGEVIE